jgi:uncharacterized protein
MEFEFEWDDVKAADNLADHKVSFETATAAFRDPCAVELLDDRENYDEERVILLGHAFGTLLSVVYACEGATRIGVSFPVEEKRRILLLVGRIRPAPLFPARDQFLNLLQTKVVDCV